MCTLSDVLRAWFAPFRQVFSTFSKAHFHPLTLGRFHLSLLLAIFCFAGVQQNLYALDSINIQAGNAQVTEGGSGYIDVFFDIPAGNALTYDLAAYNIELDLSAPPAQLYFTQFAEPQNAVFSGRTPHQAPNSPFTLPGIVAAASDDVADSITIADNAGLIRVFFDTELGSAGVYNLTINSDPFVTNFSNGNGDSFSELSTLSLSYVPGSITVQAIPEPSTITLLSFFFAVAMVYRYLRLRSGLKQ
jgi:hypothetical protein